MHQVPEYGTTTPTAGWYPDPANATLERWWGGVEWTDTTRPVPVAPPAGMPDLAAVPGGGVNPFATEKAPSWGASTTPTGQAQSVGSFYSDPYLTSTAATATVAPGWYDQGKMTQAEPATNGAATRSLVFGIISWFFNPLFIPTIVALVSAKRGLENAQMFEYERREPVGRTAAKWGRGLAIANVVLFVGAVGLGVWGYFAGDSLLRDMVTSQMSSIIPTAPLDDVAADAIEPSAGPSDAPTVAPDASNPGPWAGYEGDLFEKVIIADFVKESGVAPTSVDCPDTLAVA